MEYCMAHPEEISKIAAVMGGGLRVSPIMA